MHQKHHLRLLVLYILKINNLIVILYVIIISYTQFFLNFSYVILKKTFVETSLGFVNSAWREYCLQKYIELLPTTFIHLEPIVIFAFKYNMM